MSEKKSIGYIPPTPFRDDSDVFVLPAEGESELIPSDEQQAWLAEELETIRAQRASLNSRNAEIVTAFQLVLRQVNEQATKNPSKKVDASIRSVEASRSEPPATVAPLKPSGAPPAQPTLSAAPVVVAAAPVESPAEPDRLAVLKAQLASRIKSFQSTSDDQSHPSTERGGA